MAGRQRLARASDGDPLGVHTQVGAAGLDVEARSIKAAVEQLRHHGVGQRHHRHVRLLTEREAKTKRPMRRSEEHTSELQSLMRISYAVSCLKKKKDNTQRDKLQILTTTQ